MARSRLVLFFAGRDETDVASTERISRTLEREHLDFQVFDISQKYTLYGHTFTYENSFVLDHCENGSTNLFFTPALRAGKKYFLGEEEISKNIPYLKTKYSR